MKTKLTLLAFLILSFLTKAQEEYYAVNYRYASPEYSATFDGVDDCIETGVLMGPDIKIEMKVEVSSYEAFDKFFNTSNPPFFGIGVRNNGGEKIYGLADNSTYDIVDLVLDSAIVITFDANKGYFGVGNNRVPFTPRSVSSGDPLIIGGSSVFSQFSNIEFYYCKVWKQGRLIRYFLPQVDGTIKDIKNDVTYENTEMGNELVINGQFTYPKDSGDWQGIDWTWDGIRMVNGGGNDWLWQVGTLPTNNTEYLVSFDINQTNEVGAIGAYRGIGAQVIEQNITSGSHSYNFHAGVAYFPSDNFLGFKTNTGWLGTVDNVSVIPIGRTTFPVTRLDGENLYYVATDGNDGGTGAINDPFATIQHAFDVSSAGQTIVLFGGVYNEVLNFANKGGSPGSSILIRAYAGEKPILSGFYTVTDFTSNGNIHTSTGAVTTLNSANVILYNNNVLTHPAREPNEGYWRIGDSVYQNQHFVSEQAFGYTLGPRRTSPRSSRR